MRKNFISQAEGKIYKNVVVVSFIYRKMCTFVPEVGWIMCEKHKKVGMKMCDYVQKEDRKSSSIVVG